MPTLQMLLRVWETLEFYYKKTTRFVWKTTPSEARVTRDEVSGYMKQGETAVWKTVPVSIIS